MVLVKHWESNRILKSLYLGNLNTLALNNLKLVIYFSDFNIMYFFLFVLTARDGWTLSWRVLHHIQACQAWPTWYWCYSLISLHPSEVVNQLAIKYIKLLFICSLHCPTCLTHFNIFLHESLHQMNSNNSQWTIPKNFFLRHCKWANRLPSFMLQIWGWYSDSKYLILITTLALWNHVLKKRGYSKVLTEHLHAFVLVVVPNLVWVI